jgi:hypothetical protein
VIVQLKGVEGFLLPLARLIGSIWVKWAGHSHAARLRSLNFQEVLHTYQRLCSTKNPKILSLTLLAGRNFRALHHELMTVEDIIIAIFLCLTGPWRIFSLTHGES